MYDEIMINISVDLAYLQTSEMTADVLSKPLCGEKFFKFAASIQGGERIPKTKKTNNKASTMTRIDLRRQGCDGFYV